MLKILKYVKKEQPRTILLSKHTKLRWSRLTAIFTNQQFRCVWLLKLGLCSLMCSVTAQLVSKPYRELATNSILFLSSFSDQRCSNLILTNNSSICAVFSDGSRPWDKGKGWVVLFALPGFFPFAISSPWTPPLDPPLVFTPPKFQKSGNFQY